MPGVNGSSARVSGVLRRSAADWFIGQSCTILFRERKAGRNSDQGPAAGRQLFEGRRASRGGLGAARCKGRRARVFSGNCDGLMLGSAGDPYPGIGVTRACRWLEGAWRRGSCIRRTGRRRMQPLPGAAYCWKLKS